METKEIQEKKLNPRVFLDIEIDKKLGNNLKKKIERKNLLIIKIKILNLKKINK